MRIAIYSIWILLPLAFFVVALWSKLEDFSGRERRENIGDYTRQGFYVSLCVLIAICIDQFFLEDLVFSFAPDFMPLGFFQIMLLPVILLCMAKLTGPTQALRIKGHRQQPPQKKKKRKKK